MIIYLKKKTRTLNNIIPSVFLITKVINYSPHAERYFRCIIHTYTTTRITRGTFPNLYRIINDINHLQSKTKIGGCMHMTYTLLVFINV